MQRFKTMRNLNKISKRVASDSEQLPAEGGRRLRRRDRRIYNDASRFDLSLPQRFYTACHTNIDITI